MKTSLIIDLDDIVAAMSCGLGVTLSPDDSGTGYSVLSSLRELPIDNLKINKAFTDDIVDQARAAWLSCGVLGLAAQPQIVAIGEGVETSEQCNRVHQLKYHQVQGY